MSNKIYSIDENSLDIIDSEDKAYFLGFFFADGHNSSKNEICITIQERDGYILNNFLRILKSNHTIKRKEINGRTYSELRITNKKLSNRLRDIGANSNKTFNARFPSQISDNLTRHFIRGFLDGDGSIDCNNPRVSFVGTYDMMADLQLIVESMMGIKGYIVEDLRSEKIYYYNIYGGKKCEEFLNHLYTDSNIYLHRKYKKYLSLKNRNKDGWELRRYKYGNNGMSKESVSDKVINYLKDDSNTEYNKRNLLSMFINNDRLNKANIAYHINKIIDKAKYIDGIDIKNGYGKIKVSRK